MILWTGLDCCLTPNNYFNFNLNQFFFSVDDAKHIFNNIKEKYRKAKKRHDNRLLKSGNKGGAAYELPENLSF